MIYFDNSATTFPKPEKVTANTFSFLKTSCANPGRSAHKMSIESSRQVFECRFEIANMFNINDPTDIAFTKNCSEALNIGIFSNLEENDHVITSVLEHNSIIRALEHIKSEKNIEITYLNPDEDMTITDYHIENNIKPNTKMVVLSHANNLVGTFYDIEKIGQITKKYNILFMVDAAQSAGKKNIDVQKMNIDILCAPGHKSLYGFTGTGFIYANEQAKVKPVLYGGTGSFSDDIHQPQIMPDKLETGTLNVVGIKSLLEGIRWINSVGIDIIGAKENALAKYIIRKLIEIEGVTVYTPLNDELAGIVSFNIDGLDSSFVAGVLDLKYDIAVRGGLHCNPLGHRYLGTLESGFIRASLSYFNNMNEADKFISAVKSIKSNSGLNI